MPAILSTFILPRIPDGKSGVFKVVSVPKENQNVGFFSQRNHNPHYVVMNMLQDVYHKEINKN
jgi:hypothetical protein